MTGRRLVTRLCAEGHDVTAIGRDAVRFDALDPRAHAVTADLERPETVKAALAGVRRVASCAPARFTGNLLDVLPETCERLVLMGSTRRFSALLDPAADAVRAGEAAFLASGVAGVMLHPSMIYGAPEDRNVNRILRLVRRTPVAPLPGGGRHRLQPLFVDDAVAALVAALFRREAPGPPIVIAGPEPIRYADMVRACARATGRTIVTVPLPSALMRAGIRLASSLGFEPPFDAAEIRRAGEDKVFDVSEMRTRLGVAPRSFEDGLRLKLERGRC